MELRVAIILWELILITHWACSSELSTPRNVKVKASVLNWSRPEDHTNIVYAVQYNTTLNEWHDVYRGPEQQFNFAEAGEDFYGTTFRVRSERENQTSKWVLSELVQCAHLHTCAPVMELKVETDKVHLWMQHRDQSLSNKKGRHIEFKLLYWKKNSTDKQTWDEVLRQDSTANSTHVVLKDLEPEQEYCFQVEYLYFHKPYGKPSPEICKVIPETSKQRNLRVVMTGVLIVVVLVIVGSCLYFAYMHHRRIKALLQPPLDIPEHFEEFFFSELSHRPASHPASQVTQESFEFVSFVDELAEDEDRRADEENASSTRCDSCPEQL